MRILVTGAKGQLGTDMVAYLLGTGHDVVGVDKEQLDLSDLGGIGAFLDRCQPDAIIHCGAYTAVDRAEDEPDTCFLVNSESVRLMADYCQKTGALFIFISTDYVFDGLKPAPYFEGDPTGPVNVYGASKERAEAYIKQRLTRYFIVRISWVFGPNGGNFVKTMLRLGSQKDTLQVVADQFGSPTYTMDLVPVLYQMLSSTKYGTYHATNEGECSWHAFAQEIFRIRGMAVQVEPVPAANFLTKAARPQNSRMSKSKLKEAGFAAFPTWEDALRRFLTE